MHDNSSNLFDFIHLCHNVQICSFQYLNTFKIGKKIKIKFRAFTNTADLRSYDSKYR